ncbi:Uncharacterised protein [Candidatus Burarchaeum australiense]|nr:Uncharacterised protein [Candidatus Burarchaeum australiense]
MSKLKEEQIKIVVEWCEEIKRQKKRSPIIERNIFEEFDWMRSKTLIEIDMPLESAEMDAVVYDSVLRCLWEWRNGQWAKVEKD